MTSDYMTGLLHIYIYIYMTIRHDYKIIDIIMYLPFSFIELTFDNI